MHSFLIDLAITIDKESQYKRQIFKLSYLHLNIWEIGIPFSQTLLTQFRLLGVYESMIIDFGEEFGCNMMLTFLYALHLAGTIIILKQARQENCRQLLSHFD